MTLRAEPLSRRHYAHGEGIRWDARRQELLWVDIEAGHVLRAQLDDVDAPQVHDAGRTVGAVTPYLDSGWLLAAGRGLLAVDEAGAQHELADLEPEGVRMNDAACDPHGRFWAGGMALDRTPGAASLHRLDVDGTATAVLHGLTISNGLAWSPDGRTAYLNDSGPSVTWAFDWDEESGSLSRQRPLVQHEHGYCDGLAIDDEGCLWVPLWDAGAVDRIDPQGRRIARVELDARQPSDCCLVDGLLVITTATDGMHAPGPSDGLLHVVEVGVGGPPVVPYAGAPRWGST
ncbi:MAG: Gluconolactonase [Frankiales bacterium]|nr:Gluconolactonase [Frankiales bacterium]